MELGLRSGTTGIEDEVEEIPEASHFKRKIGFFQQSSTGSSTSPQQTTSRGTILLSNSSTNPQALFGPLQKPLRHLNRPLEGYTLTKFPLILVNADG